jgi:C1A family cysteine protease
VHAYGTIPDRPDRRDFIYSPKKIKSLPALVDLSDQCPPVYNQGKLNACSANALAAAVWMAERQSGARPVAASRLFIYYNERAQQRTVSANDPVPLRDGFKTLARQGVCAESLWPYRVKRFARRPPPSAYRAAKKHRARSYQRIAQRLAHLKYCLAEGYPFAMGVAVYKGQGLVSTASRRTGRVGMPRGRRQLLGGHAVLAVGYSDRRQSFFVRNSWGRRWGLRGYFWLPYRYVTDPSLAWDFWTLRVES